MHPPLADSCRHRGWNGGGRLADAEILAAYPDLVAQDIREALKYAADAGRERELPLIAP